MVALAVVATSCTLATARAAIRQTHATIPSLAGATTRADPAFADRAVCFRGGFAVSIASGGTAGDIAWIAFAPKPGGGWRVVNAAGGYKLGIFGVRGSLVVAQPVYRRNDPNCCPTGGFDWASYGFDGEKLELVRRWHTKTFTRP
jgi:hypothetical protein